MPAHTENQMWPTEPEQTAMLSCNMWQVYSIQQQDVQALIQSDELLNCF